MPNKAKVLDLEDIVRQVAERTQGTIKDTSKVVDALLDVLSDNLQKGHTIHLADFATLAIPPQKSSQEQ